MRLVYDLTAKIGVCSTIQMQKAPSNAPVYDLTANDNLDSVSQAQEARETPSWHSMAPRDPKSVISETGKGGRSKRLLLSETSLQVPSLVTPFFGFA